MLISHSGTTSIGGTSTTTNNNHLLLHLLNRNLLPVQALKFQVDLVVDQVAPAQANLVATHGGGLLTGVDLEIMAMALDQAHLKHLLPAHLKHQAQVHLVYLLAVVLEVHQAVDQEVHQAHLESQHLKICMETGGGISTGTSQNQLQVVVTKETRPIIIHPVHLLQQVDQALPHHLPLFLPHLLLQAALAVKSFFQSLQ